MSGEGSNTHPTVHHAQLGGPLRYSIQQLPNDPDGQVAHTIRQMIDYAITDSRSFLIQQDARLALQLGNGDPVSGVFRLVKSRMKFQQDHDTAMQVTGLPVDPEDVVEVLIRPVDTSQFYRQLGQAIEDCDGFQMYGASLLLALGIPVAFVTISAEDEDPSRFSHVYLAAYPKHSDGSVERVAIDCSHGPYPGWEGSNLGRMREWPVQPMPNFLGDVDVTLPVFAMMFTVGLGLVLWVGQKFKG